MFNFPLSLPMHLLPQHPLSSQDSDLPFEEQKFKEKLEDTFKQPLEYLLKNIGKNKRNLISKNLTPWTQRPKSKKNWTFKLVLASPISSVLCKSKYFNVKVALVSTGTENLPMAENLVLEAMVYNKDGGVISRNMNGNEILRGDTVQTMNFYIMEMKHLAYFRMQVTEVSSHFIGKKIDLVIKAKKSEFLQRTGWTVKNLVLKNVIVKAKENKI